MNLLTRLGGTANSLLGPWQLEVTPVSTPPIDTLVDVASLALVRTWVPTLWVVRAVECRRAMLRNVLLSERGLMSLAQLWKMVWTRCDILPQMLKCVGMKTRPG